MFDCRWLAASGAVLLSGVVQGATGFGFSILSIPLLVNLYEPRIAISLNIMLSLGSLAVLSWDCRRDASGPILRGFAGGSLLGVPLGLWVFARTSTAGLKLFVHGAVLVAALVIMAGDLAGARFPGRPPGTGEQAAGNAAPYVVAGVISGFLATSISMPGPPVILFLSWRGLPKATFRATLVIYFVFAYLISLVLLAATGAVTRSVPALALSLFPFALLGNRAGTRMFRRVSQRSFRRLVPLVLMGVGLYGLARALFRHTAGSV